MDKQKQIEQIARIIKAVKYEPFNDGKPTYTVGVQMQDFVFDLIGEALYNAGYRKIPENAVVIEKSEYEKLRLLADECIDWRRKNCNVGELPKENAVVLTREEYNELCCSIGVSREEVDRVVDMVEKDTRKETAEKFAERLKALGDDGVISCLLFNEIDEICKEITEGVL